MSPRKATKSVAADRAEALSKRRAGQPRPALAIVSSSNSSAAPRATGTDEQGAGIPPIAGPDPSLRGGRVPLALIDIAPDRLRELDPERARFLAQTYPDVGQLQAVRLVREASGRFMLDGHGFGVHRIEAARLCGWTEVDAAWLLRAEVEQARYRLPEIIENLARHGFDALGEAEHLYELKVIHERLHPPQGRGGDRRSRKARANHSESNSYWSFAAESSGLSRRAIEIKIAMWTALGPDVRLRLRGTTLADNQGALRQIAALHEQLQVKVVDLLLATPQGAASVHEAILLAQGKRLDTPDEKKFSAASGSVARLAAPVRGVIFDHYADEIIARFRSKGLL